MVSNDINCIVPTYDMQTTKGEILNILNEVTDPEVPVLSIIDLGIVRNVNVENNRVEVFITPTYSGCPAMDTIKTNIQKCLLQHGYKNFQLTTILSPAWTTDWMSERGKEKLKAFGIAPRCPSSISVNRNYFTKEKPFNVPCAIHIILK